MRLLPSLLACALPFAPAACAPVCEPEPLVTGTRDAFTDVSESSGVQLGNVLDPAPEGLRSNDHPRLALVDLDGDGFDDLVAHSLLVNPMAGLPYTHVVLRNQGDGTFEDFAAHSGLAEAQVAFFAFGDVDNDGDPDAFGGIDLVDWQDHTHGIWLNDGTGAFTRLPDAGVEDEPAYAAGAAFADLDGDAHLDLFLANGSTLAAVEDAVFWGRGDGTFERGRLRGAVAQPSNGVVACDLDDDGDQDLLVSTYGVSVLRGHNHLWRNNGDRTFPEVGQDWGFSAQLTGNRWMTETGNGQDPEPGADLSTAIGSNGFGLDCADVNSDGRLDVWLATISHPDAEPTRQWSDPTQLLINDGSALLDRAEALGLPFNEGDIDAAIADFDNDGRLDLSLTREAKYEARYTDDEQRGWLGLFHQQPDGQFRSAGLRAGINQPDVPDSLIMKGGQNLAWSDLDHDGDLDLVVGGRDQGGGRANRLFRNELGHQNPWLIVELRGDGAQINADAMGARLTLRAGERALVREKKSGRGTYASSDGAALHFGLGGADCMDTLTVRWPDGTEFEVEARDLQPRTRVRLTYPDLYEILP
jgi:hypothetical protein